MPASVVHHVFLALRTDCCKACFLCFDRGARPALDGLSSGRGARQEAFPMLQAVCGVHVRIRFMQQRCLSEQMKGSALIFAFRKSLVAAKAIAKSGLPDQYLMLSFVFVLEWTTQEVVIFTRHFCCIPQCFPLLCSMTHAPGSPRGLSSLAPLKLSGAAETCKSEKFSKTAETRRFAKESSRLSRWRTCFWVEGSRHNQKTHKLFFHSRSPFVVR